MSLGSPWPELSHLIILSGCFPWRLLWPFTSRPLPFTSHPFPRHLRPFTSRPLPHHPPPLSPHITLLVVHGGACRPPSAMCGPSTSYPSPPFPIVPCHPLPCSLFYVARHPARCSMSPFSCCTSSFSSCTLPVSPFAPLLSPLAMIYHLIGDVDNLHNKKPLATN
jgi:hypothetical protein